MALFETTTEQYIDHEVRIRLQDVLYRQLNRKLNIIMAICGAILTAVIIPIGLHSMKLV